MGSSEVTIRELYNITNENIQNDMNRIWGTVKFFSTVFIGLATITITLLTSFYEILGLYVVCFSFFPVISFITTQIGLDNFKNECARLLEQIADKIKIEEILGLHKSRKEILKNLGYNTKIKLLPKDEYIFSKKYIDIDIKSTSEFIKLMGIIPYDKKYECVNYNFVFLFKCYKLISILLIALIYFCALFHLKSGIDLFKLLVVTFLISIVSITFRSYCLNTRPED